MTVHTSVVASLLALATLTAAAPGIAARAERPAVPRVQQADAPGDAALPVLARLRKVRHEAGLYSGAALPPRFGGQAILPEEPSAAREEDGMTSLSVELEDGSDLFYYNQLADDVATMSAWQGAADGRSSASLYGTAAAGDVSSSLGFTQSAQEGEVYTSRGQTLWDPGPESGVVPSVTRFSSSYGTTFWAYESTEHRFADFQIAGYSGTGSMSPDGASSDYQGFSSLDDASGRVQECVSMGSSTTRTDGVYEVVSDYWDVCDRLAEPYDHYSSWSHSEYRYTYGTSTTAYVFVGAVDCTDGAGALRHYWIEYDPDAWVYEYWDLDLDQAVDAMDCAWEPVEESVGVVD